MGVTAAMAMTGAVRPAQATSTMQFHYVNGHDNPDGGGHAAVFAGHVVVTTGKGHFVAQASTVSLKVEELSADPDDTIRLVVRGDANQPVWQGCVRSGATTAISGVKPGESLSARIGEKLTAPAKCSNQGAAGRVSVTNATLW